MKKEWRITPSEAAYAFNLAAKTGNFMDGRGLEYRGFLRIEVGVVRASYIGYQWTKPVFKLIFGSSMINDIDVNEG
jgi:hypothetical protein